MKIRQDKTAFQRISKGEINLRDAFFKGLGYIGIVLGVVGIFLLLLKMGGVIKK